MKISKDTEFLKIIKNYKITQLFKKRIYSSMRFIDREQQVEENICALENILNVNVIYAKILTKWDHI